MNKTICNSLRRRLQLALRYRARELRETRLTVSAKYYAMRLLWRLLWYVLLICIGSLFYVVFSFDRSNRRGRVGSIHIIDGTEESGPTFGRVTTEALLLLSARCG